MLPFEQLVLGYLAFFAVFAPFARVDARRRVGVVAGAVAVATGVVAAAATLPVEARLWLGFPYIAVGYWIPVPLVPPRTRGAFEAWLVRTDAPVRRLRPALPRWLAQGAEVGYLLCFPMIPAAFAVVWLAGSSADVARFWLAVLAAGLVCYGTLPWLVSRPPREAEHDAHSLDAAPVTRLNVRLLQRVSHHLNTFPSGHVAVSVAAAIRAGEASPVAGLVLGLVAAGVALGAVVGRHHYTADVVSGAALGIAVS